MLSGDMNKRTTMQQFSKVRFVTVSR